HAVVFATATISRRRLPGVAGAKRAGRRGLPGEVVIAAPVAGQLQRGTAGRAAGLGLRDRRARLAGRRTVAGTERAFVGNELHDRAGAVDQGDAVGSAILDAGNARPCGAESVALVGDAARQRYRGVALAVA